RPWSSRHASSMIRWPASGSRPVVSVSSTILRIPSPFLFGAASAAQRFHSPVRERIRPLVPIMPGMALHPHPPDLVRADHLVELPPEVGILHRLFRGGLPAARLPAVDPFGDALLHVLRIRVEHHRARTPKRPERLDD